MNRATARPVVAIASGFNLVLGIWLCIAPFALGYTSGDPLWNDLNFGVVIVVLATVRLIAGRAKPSLSYANVAIGIWIFASAFWLDESARAVWNDMLTGTAVVVLGLISGAASADARRQRHRR